MDDTRYDTTPQPWRGKTLTPGDIIIVQAERIRGKGIYKGVSRLRNDLFIVDIHGKAEWINERFLSYPDENYVPKKRKSRILN